MKILLLHRALVNGGDYLFVNKTRQVFEHERSHDELAVVHFDELEAMSIEQINQYDRIIVGGGPYYDNRFINCEEFRIFRDLNKIKSVIHFIGVGWYGDTGMSSEIYSYTYLDEALDCMREIERRGGRFGCRDYITQNVLRNNGITRTIMTGCCAWYHYGFIGRQEFNEDVDFSIRKIAISDPGLTKDENSHDMKFQQVCQVIKLLREHYSKAELFYTFNGGINTKYSSAFNSRVKDMLEAEQIPYYDLSCTDEKFRVYDDADLHVGFRVHSHLYNLSMRKPTVLLEEDARGKGANQALGLRNIPCFDYQDPTKSNPYIVEELDSYLTDLKNSSYVPIKSAFVLIDGTFNNLKDFLADI